MNTVHLDYHFCLLDKKDLDFFVHRLVDFVPCIRNASYAYHNAYSSVYVPFDDEICKHVYAVVQEKKRLNPTVFVVIGIGGSSLGTKAIHQALHGRFYHANNPLLRIYFAETVDSDRLSTIIRVVEQELIAGNNVLINVVTKSGTTMETVVNFEVLLSVLKKHRPHSYRNCVVVTTDRGSPLWHIAQEERFVRLWIPHIVGGRYSVFSPVSLFPLAFIGIDIHALRLGAQDMVKRCTQAKVQDNPALLSASILFAHYQQGIRIHDLFLFSVELEALGKWYRQLMAESVGKEYNIHNQKVFAGITPTVSLGSIDLHSVAQLYLAGPRDRFTTFVTIGTSKHRLYVPRLVLFDKNFASLQGKAFASIMDAIAQGTQQAYKRSGRPFATIMLPEKNAYHLGQFLQYKMIEMMYLGYLMEVNPFDQPNVELYKQETRHVLND